MGQRVNRIATTSSLIKQNFFIWVDPLIPIHVLGNIKKHKFPAIKYEKSQVVRSEKAICFTKLP